MIRRFGQRPANDVRDVDLTNVHVLSGPIAVEGAEPGDLLVVDILGLGPIPQEQGDVAGQDVRQSCLGAPLPLLRSEYPGPATRGGRPVAGQRLP